MRLDHLLSKEEQVEEVWLFSYEGSEEEPNISGGDALRGHTRSHPEHDG